MNLHGQAYCGDGAMRDLLEKCGSRRSLIEVYGLFHGCVAAPRLVRPSDFLDIILGAPAERRPFESLDDANRVLGNIMALWNLIAGWKPEDGTAAFPAGAYPESTDGLRQMLRDHSSFMKYFTKGLDLGGLRESDIKGALLAAFKDLASVGAIHEQLLDVLARDTSAQESTIADVRSQVVQLKDAMLHCVARLNAGLRAARIAEARELGMQAGGKAAGARPAKIHGNQFCPCGSGKKYKKCCAGSA